MQMVAIMGKLINCSLSTPSFNLQQRRLRLDIREKYNYKDSEAVDKDV